MMIAPQNFMPFYIIFLLAGFAERMNATFSPKETTADKISYHKWLFKILLSSYLVIVALSILEYMSMPKPINLTISLTGLMIYTIGMLLRRAAIKELAQVWSMLTVIKKHHKLITSGIYSRLKHPYYLAVAFELIGVCLIPNSFFSLIPVLFIQIPLLLIRINLEEKILVQHFGINYQDYARSKII